MREETINWLKQAEIDLETAKDNLIYKKFYASAFFSQQAAEKALKAFAIEKLREPIPTHNLLILAKKMKVPSDVLTALIDLNSDFIISRYPDAANGLPAEQYDLKKAKRKISFAKKTINWVKKWIKH